MPVNWLEIVTIDYLTDFDGEEPGIGGCTEVGYGNVNETISA